MLRTTHCGDLRIGHAGETVTLSGWVHTRRDHGGLIFIDLRDRYGLVQVVFNPELAPEAHAAAERFRSEWVVQVRGTVNARPEGTANPGLTTGEIEVMASTAQVLNESKTPPFEVADGAEVDELLRLKYRYIDLRRPTMQETIALRHRVVKYIRDFLDERGFYEIETPILIKSTPEGARDYLVPSRLYPGQFYALPQSPQQLKQLLMVAGMDKYFQIARCFRDEDPRADRQPEHTQLDLEMSFVEQDDVLGLIEDLYTSMIEELVPGKRLVKPFPRLSYQEAMDRFASDKPDLRFGLEMADLTDLASKSEFRVFSSVASGGGYREGIQCPRRRGIRAKAARRSGGVHEDAGRTGPGLRRDRRSGVIARRPDRGRLQVASRALPVAGRCAGDRSPYRCGARRPRAHRRRTGQVHQRRPQRPTQRDGQPPRPRRSRRAPLRLHRRFSALRVERGAGQVGRHAPRFSMPKDDSIQYLESDPGRVMANLYDLVCNGVECASGSIRVHQRELQERIFKVLGYTEEQVGQRFKQLLDALEYGAPPHGGIAPGIDRLIMVLLGIDNIRDVVAFPKTQNAIDPLFEAPDTVEDEQLRELRIRIVE